MTDTTGSHMSTVTAAQLHILAANANDRRILTEAHALAEAIGVDPDAQIASISYEPRRGPRDPRLTVVSYQLDDEGDRIYVHEDGTPYDPAAGKPWRAATVELTKAYKGMIPTWWDMAERTVAQTVAAE